MVAGYIRVSHVGAREAERFHSPDDQAEQIRAWAKRHRKRVKILPAELDAKGSDRDRPIFRQAVEGVKQGKYEGVVVAYLSRAGRDLRLMLDLWDEVEQAGGTIWSVKENIDASTPNGKLQRNILASIDQHYLEERRADFDRVRRSAVERGVWAFRQTPRGYRKGADRKLAPDRQAPSVRAAFKNRAAGVAISQIARDIKMTTSGVRQMIANRVYLGELRVGPYLNRTAHEPIVDPDTWHAAQRSQPRPARSGQPALAAGLVRCSGCGHVMSRSGTNRVYICARQHSGGACKEPAAVTATLIDTIVNNYGRELWDSLAASATQGDTAEAARAELVEAERELAAYLGAVSAVDVGAEAFGEGARTRRDRVLKARDALDVELGKQLAVPEGVEWEDVPVQLRNQFLRDTLAAVVVKRAGGRGSRTPLPERVRILERDFPLTPLKPIPLPRLDVPHVLGVERFQNPAL